MSAYRLLSMKHLRVISTWPTFPISEMNCICITESLHLLRS